jgi:ABC-type uncharacterized transport system substrate-binding protein
MSQTEWSRIIDPNSIHKMLYSLQLVSQLISINNEKLSEAEISERIEWRSRFLELGGFDHLYFILITYDFDNILPDVKQINSWEEVKVDRPRKKQKVKAVTQSKS